MKMLSNVRKDDDFHPYTHRNDSTQNMGALYHVRMDEIFQSHINSCSRTNDLNRQFNLSPE